MRSPTSRTGRATPVDGRAGSTVASSATPREPTDGTRVLDRPRRNVAAVPTTTTASVSATRGCYRCGTRRPVGAHRRPPPPPVSYTHLRAHETDSYLVCRLLLEKKKNT